MTAASGRIVFTPRPTKSISVISTHSKSPINSSDARSITARDASIHGTGRGDPLANRRRFMLCQLERGRRDDTGLFWSQRPGRQAGWYQAVFVLDRVSRNCWARKQRDLSKGFSGSLKLNGLHSLVLLFDARGGPFALRGVPFGVEIQCEAIPCQNEPIRQAGWVNAFPPASGPLSAGLTWSGERGEMMLLKIFDAVLEKCNSKK
ncbi:hypothetical protein QBC47DRAFT_383700 [Echria macrotheca]|uniref:Uncharacterized protein n=1 Tax=Echria macrotheca TaxID=438768 RepID=A0AAJ0F491_9PEZI|nr:hypothetical protein QBC47DRAFT_383700 [Echria macrotheca]